jgi:hypothetical protein
MKTFRHYLKEAEQALAPAAPAAGAAPVSTAAPAAAATTPTPDTKENFIKHLRQQVPNSPETDAILERVIAVDYDGTIDFEETLLNMGKVLTKEIAPQFLNSIGSIIKQVEAAKTNPAEWNKFTPEQQKGMEEAIQEWNKTMPKVMADMAKEAEKLDSPEIQGAIANKQNARFKQKTGTDMIRGGYGQKSNIGTVDYNNPNSAAPTTEDVELTTMLRIAGLR